MGKKGGKQKPGSLTPNDVIEAADEAGLTVRNKGTHVVIRDDRENSPTRGEMLSIGAHTTGDYPKPLAHKIRKWFARLGITILVLILAFLYYAGYL